MYALIFIANLFAITSAFLITSPSAGEVLDPTQPITFSWTSDSSDPATFDILLDDSTSGGLTSDVRVASGVSTTAGSYILSTSSVRTYGTGFVLKAQSSSGNVLATSPIFILAMNSGSSSTYTGTISHGRQSTDSTQATLGGAGSSTVSNSVSIPGGNSFTTSTISRGGSSTGTSSSSSLASATTSQNAQPKLVSSSQIAFTAAGFIAGLAALLA